MSARRTGRGGAFRAAGLFALGAMVGGLAGLLSAPASGALTRRRIVARVRTAERRIGRQLNATKRTLIRQAEQTYQNASRWVTSHVPNGYARRSNGRARRPVRQHVAHA